MGVRDEESLRLLDEEILRLLREIRDRLPVGAPVYTAPPMGCVCPAGTVCANPMCPRRSYLIGPTCSSPTAGSPQ